MQKIIEELNCLQKNSLSQTTIAHYQELTQTSPKEIKELMTNPDSPKSHLAQTVSATIDFGTILTSLNQEEYAIIKRAIASKTSIENFLRVLSLYEQYANYLKKYLQDLPIYQEQVLLNVLKRLATSQDQALLTLIESYPHSSLIRLSTDHQKEELTRLYQKITHFKSEGIRLGLNYLRANLSQTIESNAFYASIPALYNYCYVKARIEGNLDDDIIALHRLARLTSMNNPSPARTQYTQISETIHAKQAEYQKLRLKMQQKD